MSKVEFEEGCHGCTPVMLDFKTGRPFPDDSPIVVATNKVWALTTLEERKAFHRVTCQNSRAFDDLRVMQELTMKIGKEIEAYEARIAN